MLVETLGTEWVWVEPSHHRRVLCSFIGGSMWTLSQMVLGITLYSGFQVKLSERVPSGIFKKVLLGPNHGSTMETS